MVEASGIEILVEQAKEGSPKALEAVVSHIQNHVYNLALRMLQVPADAEDATQEILIKVVTHLSEFRHESAFTTWVYRVATNYLLTARKRRAELQHMTFQQLGETLEQSLASGEAALPDGYDQHLLAEEVRLHCTLGMLICLDRVHRIAFILGEIFEVSGEEGAYIMETTPAAFRQRLSRARLLIKTFVQQKCGIVNPDNPCRCQKHIGNAIQVGSLKPARLKYASQVNSHQDMRTVHEHAQELRELDRVAALFRTHPEYSASEGFVKGMKLLLQSGKYPLFRG